MRFVGFITISLPFYFIQQREETRKSETKLAEKLTKFIIILIFSIQLLFIFKKKKNYWMFCNSCPWSKLLILKHIKTCQRKWFLEEIYHENRYWFTWIKTFLAMIPNCKLFDKPFGNVLQALKIYSLNHSQLGRERKNNWETL